MKIAFLGSRGVPARYGGFETVCEEIGSRLAERGHEIVVYCRNPGQRDHTYAGMRLINLPAVRAKAAETLSHTFLSAVHAVRHRPDVAIVFNTANSPVLPILRAGNVPVVLVSDGLEWKRDKWGRVARSYSKMAERRAAKWADQLVVDSRAVGEYFEQTYGAITEYITYGARILDEQRADALRPLGLTKRGYHLVVARLEPENNVHVILEGYRAAKTALPLVVIGGAPYSSAYQNHLKALARSDDRVRLVGSVWDQASLDQLYAHASIYLHGHSVGGTNPSLLRAMGAARPVIAYDVAFNREVLADRGRYFEDDLGLRRELDDLETTPAEAERLGELARLRVGSEYAWDDSVAKLEALCARLKHNSLP